MAQPAQKTGSTADKSKAARAADKTRTGKTQAARAAEGKPGKPEPARRAGLTRKAEPTRKAETEKPSPLSPPAYLQAKLAVSHPADAAEREADAIAYRIARAPRPDAVQPQPGAGKTVQRDSLEPVHPREKVDSLSMKSSAAPTQPEKKAAAAPSGQEAAPTLPKTGPGTISREAAGQAAQDGVAGHPVSPETEKNIESRRGSGEPLPEPLAGDMETRFGEDFSSVRIHNDAEAAALCAQTRARAFTVGNDVFFAPGEYAPETAAGRELLAHELTHVAQQGQGARRVMRRERAGEDASGSKQIARKDGGSKGKGGDKAAGKEKRTKAKGRLVKGTAKPELHIDGVDLPSKPGMEKKFTAKWGSGPWKVPSAEARANQIEDWKNQVKGVNSKWSFAGLLGEDNTLPESTTGKKIYALKLKEKGGKGYIIGTEESIREKATLPWWNKTGAPHSYDVDHILELQLGGEANSKDNFQLLDSSANRSSGSRTKTNLDRAIGDAIPPTDVDEGVTVPKELTTKLPGRGKAAGGAGSPAPAGPAPAAPAAKAPAPAAGAGGEPAAVKEESARDKALAEITKNCDIFFDKVTFTQAVSGSPDEVWDFASIEKMQHLTASQVEKATKDNAKELYDKDKLRLLPRPGGGTMFFGELKGPVGAEKVASQNWGEGVVVTDATFDRQSGKGTVTVDVTRQKGKKTETRPVPLDIESAGLPTLCHVVPASVQDGFRHAFRAKTLSPIELTRVEMGADANIMGSGTLTIDGIPFLAGTVIDVAIIGGDLVFSKTFDTGDFKIPGPIQIDNSSLTLSAAVGASGVGLGAEGGVEFHIGELAVGSIKGNVASNGQFGMTGTVEFDKESFTGSGSIGYDSVKGWDAAGTFKMKEGVVKGIKSATVTVAYSEEKKAVGVTADAALSLPGFKSAKFTAEGNESGDVTLTGESELSAKIPRIKGGKIKASAKRVKGTWSFNAGGELEPDIPGLAGTKIGIDYNDGILTGKVSASYKRSMVAGKVDLYAKAAVGEGKEEPIKFWGDGRVDVTAAPWLKATAGLSIDEKGEIVVSGELGLPSKLDIFPQQKVEKTLFSLSAQFPIFPGIVAEVGGNLAFIASVGPGALDTLKVGIVYNPDKEENTTITGDAHLMIPAMAALRLGARAGIGLGIPLASATGGLELGAAAGIGGAAEASVHILWMPQKGVQIDSEAYVNAEPKFILDISGYVSVKAAGFSVYDKRFGLASKEFGSSLRLGARFPIHYREGQPFKVALSDAKLELPELTADSLMRDIRHNI